jgi:hypothetical protein
MMSTALEFSLWIGVFTLVPLCALAAALRESVAVPSVEVFDQQFGKVGLPQKAAIPVGRLRSSTLADRALSDLRASHPVIEPA